ncbi:hypothetical protein AB0O68_36525 [Streptomyces sp. NPDC087512]|uniref:hypothetical protein n=1 Tax=Streptomyces sp. NPDC087512 TaxID=3155059 RepID=UPI00343B444E
MQQETAKTIAASLPKLDFSVVLKPRMTALEQILASMPKVTPQVLALQRDAAKTIAGLDRTLADPTGESHDAEASDTVETDEGESEG